MAWVSVCRTGIFPAVLSVMAAMWGAAPTVAEEVLVRVARAETAPVFNRIRLSGTVVAERAAQISTDIGGLVAKMDVDIGHRVAKGAALVHLDTALEKLELARAEAATREAREKRADAERQVKIAEELAARGNMPVNTLDSRLSETRVAAATLARLEAEEARQRERVRRHTIVAPFPGVVARKATETGEWVSPGAAVVELVQTDNLMIDTSVPQQHFAELQADPTVTLQFDALPDRTFEAHVVSRVPVSDPTTRTFILRLKPKTEDIPLTPGMSVRVDLGVATGEQGVMVSRDAVMRYPDGRTTVWIIDPQGDGKTVTERHVTLGSLSADRVHIRSGLDNGAVVVVRGNELLRPGQSVRITDNKQG